MFILNVSAHHAEPGDLTELAGLSLALGAFVAGMLISETEYKGIQVEEDIKPFRDVLMGLFSTIGVKLDLHILVGLWWQVLLAPVALLVIA